MIKQLRIPSNIAYLKEVDSFFDELLQSNKLPRSVLGYINLSICESVNNAIYHGNKQDLNKWVTISAELVSDCLYVEVADEGKGFNFKDLPDPTAKENIKNEGGRGLFIITHLVDQINFKNNGSIIQLKFILNREHQLFL